MTIRDAVKRGGDIVFCLLLLPLAGVLGILVAIAVALSSPGPVLHRATRVGRHGVPFTILKFRTMVVQKAPAPRVTASGDPRITRVGRILRRSKVDELPQLLNVLRGDMSLVGPRPEDPFYVERFADDFRAVLSVRPGITGLTAIRFRNEEAIMASAQGDPQDFYMSTVLPAKLRMDRQYVAARSPGLDLLILCVTVAALFDGSAVARVARAALPGD